MEFRNRGEQGMRGWLGAKSHRALVGHANEFGFYSRSAFWKPGLRLLLFCFVLFFLKEVLVTVQKKSSGVIWIHILRALPPALRP